MGKRLLLVALLIVSSVTTAYGYHVGTGNGAVYFVGGPPASNSNSASFGSPQSGGAVYQQATTFTPGGVGIVGQSAYAVGGQASGYHVQAQGFCAGMGQGVAKYGGSGNVVGTQSGGVGMFQSSGGSTQGSYATGMQMSGVYGGLGTAGSNAQSMHVSTGQIQIH
jgi:hypothetical protein